MKLIIWLRSAKRAWEETTTDDKGTLDISRIAKRTDLRPETLLFGDLAAYEGMTIEDVRVSCGSTAGHSKDSAVVVDGDAVPAAQTEGAEKGLISEAFFAALSNVRNEMKELSGLVRESLSYTRAASSMSDDDMTVLRRCLGAVVILEEEDVALEALLGAEIGDGEYFWDENTYELQGRDRYALEFNRMTKSRNVLWKDATGEKCKVRFDNAEFAVAAKNDLLLILRSYSSLPKIGAILGVEIKKLSWRGMRQAETEFYAWSYESQFPFIQLITDMEHGGVAIYSKGGSDVRFRTLGSMRALCDFVGGVDKNLPPTFGMEEDSKGMLINIDTLSAPSRNRFTARNSGSSSTHRLRAFWTAYNSIDDVANLRDLDVFNVVPAHQSLKQESKCFSHKYGDKNSLLGSRVPQDDPVQSNLYTG